eukprot:17442_6
MPRPCSPTSSRRSKNIASQRKASIACRLFSSATPLRLSWHNMLFYEHTKWACVRRGLLIRHWLLFGAGKIFMCSLNGTKIS